MLLVLLLGACGDAPQRRVDPLRLRLETVVDEMRLLGCDVALDGLTIELRPPHLAPESGPADYAGWLAPLGSPTSVWRKFRRKIMNFLPSYETREWSGYFAPWRNGIVISGRGSSDPLLTDWVIAHEVTHAWQMQKRKLFTQEWYRRWGTTERWNVETCVSEGEAEAVALMHALARAGKTLEDVRPDIFLANVAQGVTGSAWELEYPIGLDYVLPYVKKGGLAGLDAVYRDLPPSTEQILHGMKRGKDKPVEVTWPEAKAFVRVASDTVGELGIHAWIAAFRGRNDAFLTATGWDGDSAAVFRTNDGTRVYAWITVWDRVKDAEQFETMAQHITACDVITRHGHMVCLVACEDAKVRRRFLSAVWDQYEAPETDAEDARSTAAIEDAWQKLDRTPHFVGGRWQLRLLKLEIPQPAGWSQAVHHGRYVLGVEDAEGFVGLLTAWRQPAAIVRADSLPARFERLRNNYDQDAVTGWEQLQIDGREAYLVEHAVRYGTQWLSYRFHSLYVFDGDTLVVCRGWLLNEAEAAHKAELVKALRGVRISAK